VQRGGGAVEGGPQPRQQQQQREQAEVRVRRCAAAEGHGRRQLLQQEGVQRRVAGEELRRRLAPCALRRAVRAARRFPAALGADGPRHGSGEQHHGTGDSWR
jgi:hypothetical protein